MRFVAPADARSWVPVPDDSDFPIQNLPLARIQVGEGDPELATRIGDQHVRLERLAADGLIELPWSDWAHFTRDQAAAVRRAVFELLVESTPPLPEAYLVSSDQSETHFPVRPRSFVDFYSGIHHAENVGRMFRPDQPPLLPNYRHIPIGYNGRASTVRASGRRCQRPNGILRKADGSVTFGPTQELDFELEVGFVLGNDPRPLTAADAEDHMLGLCLVNDWSARDVQRFEYQPLGPFLAKSFHTTVSPYLVTLDALAPFRCNGMQQDPLPLPHLAQAEPRAFDLRLEVWIQPLAGEAHRVCESNMKHLYWSVAQQLAHQASNGTELEEGDLYATGTISGPEPGTYGSMLELAWKGERPIALPDGTSRSWIQDGDKVTLRGWAQGPGYRIGFGECAARVVG